MNSATTPIHKKYLFLSHNSLDKPEVESFIQQLEDHPLAQQHNLKVWLDKNSLNNNSGFPAQLADAIHYETCAFVLYLSQHPISEWMLDEINHAKKRNVDDRKQSKSYPIIPVYSSSSENSPALPAMISTFSFIEYVVGDDDKISHIIAMALGLENEDNPVSQDNTSQSPTSISTPIPLTPIELKKRQMTEKRLDTLYVQLAAIQEQRDLETRVEEQMRLDALIETKKQLIDQVSQDL